jgi:hypothetical protein
MRVERRWSTSAVGLAVLLVVGCSASVPGERVPVTTPSGMTHSSASRGEDPKLPPGHPTGATPSPGTPSTAVEVPSRAWRISSSSAPPFGIAPGARKAFPIEGFADRSSVGSGEQVRLFVSTSANRWRARAYRMGWYGGRRGALVWTSAWQPGVLQPRARTVGETHTPVAPWRASLTLTTTGWRPGTYLIRLSTQRHASYIPLTVRSPSTQGRLVLLTPDTTWQAYNDWGGRNLYWGPKGKGDYAHRARAVSFDRPYAYGKGAGEYLSRMLPVVSLAERLQLPLAYADSIDLHRNPHLLDGARGVITMGHDEYWSAPMRSHLAAARDRGTNIAFLGANAIYRRIRLQSTHLGPHRLEVNYKDPAEDPYSSTHPALTTADWAAPPHPDPPSRLTGMSYACFPGTGDLVVADPSHWLLAGTGLHKGDRLPGALGPEFDAVVAGTPTPKPLDIVLRSPVSCGQYTHADAVYYSTRSGAGVFNTGTMGWVAGLGGSYGKRTQHLEQRITTTLLREFAAGPAGRKHPAHSPNRKR